MASRELSWNWSPAESRSVRVLIYLAVSLPVGTLLAILALLGPGLVAAVAGSFELWFLGVLAVFAVVAAPRLWAIVRGHRVRKERSRLAREWAAVGIWRWGFVAGLLFGGLLVGVETAFGVGLVERPRAFVFGALLAAMSLVVTVRFLGSLGEIDPANLTLSYGDRDDIDLRYLTDVKRLTLGRYTVLWLRFAPGVDDRRAQDLYAMPTGVAERAWPVLKRGIASGTPTESGEKSDLLRRVNVFVAVVFVGGSAAVLALLVWLGSPPAELLQWVWITLGIAVFFVQFLARTI